MPLPQPGLLNQAAVYGIFGSVESLCRELGVFETVNQHEPKSPPTAGMACAVWVNAIVPLTKRSGLNFTDGSINLRIRVYTPFASQPYDAIDPNVLTSVCDLLAALSGDFTFNGQWNVRCIDLMGGEGSGEKLDATAGYLELDRKVFRIMTIRCPVIVNNMWGQAP